MEAETTIGDAVGSKGRAESTFDHTCVCISLLLLPPLLLLL
jgi:hypothetical protein